MRPYVANRDFSGTVLVARHGHAIARRAYGLADYALDVPTSVDSRYGIGSVTKTFTAAAIAILAERGALRLDDRLSRFLPELPHADSITIRQLLDHSSGVPDYYRLADFAAHRREPITIDALATMLRAAPLDFAPGSKSSYSNTGYLILSFVIARAARTSYADFIRANVLEPIGMTATGELRDHEIVPALAPGYNPGFGRYGLEGAADVSTTWLEGNGSMYSSATDLLRWGESIRSGALFPLGRYPYGWGARTRFGRSMIEQTGRVPTGYTTYLGIYPSDDLMIVVLSNIQAEIAERVGTDLAAIALGQRYAIPVVRAHSPASGADSALAGIYEIAPGFDLSVAASPKGLTLAGPDGIPLALDREGERRYFFRPLYVPVRFVTDSTGRATALDWNGEFQARRVR